MNNEFKYELKTNVWAVAEEIFRSQEMTHQNYSGSSILQSIESFLGFGREERPLFVLLYRLDMEAWRQEEQQRRFTNIFGKRYKEDELEPSPIRLPNGGFVWTTGSENYQWELHKDGSMVLRTRFRSEWRRLLSLV